MQETTIAILGAATIGIFGYGLEKLLERTSSMFKDKREIYPKFLSSEYKQTEERNEEQVSAMNLKLRMVFYGSNKAIKKYAEFRRLLHEINEINDKESDEYKEKRKHAIKKFNEFILAMRKDCHFLSRSKLKDIEAFDFMKDY